MSVIRMNFPVLERVNHLVPPSPSPLSVVHWNQQLSEK
jgi:hypothetical protein